jgi:PPOX class probable F420-dependent enzyme
VSNRRAAIAMSDEEALAFLDEQRTVTCATLGRDGWPHLMPLWYVVRGGTIWAWTYAKSQKVRNLERDARATLQVEAGVRYEELRGLMLRCDAVIHRDPAVLEAFITDLAPRYAPDGVDPAAVVDGFRPQIPKRVALEFVERARVSWDHRKLGGTY